MNNDILIIPASGIIQYSGSEDSTIQLHVLTSGSLMYSGSDGSEIFRIDSGSFIALSNDS